MLCFLYPFLFGLGLILLTWWLTRMFANSRINTLNGELNQSKTSYGALQTAHDKYALDSKAFDSKFTLLQGRKSDLESQLSILETKYNSRNDEFNRFDAALTERNNILLEREIN